jgi:hypothetical protein
MGNTAEDLTKQMKNFKLMEECIMVAIDKTAIEPLEVRSSSCVMGKLLADRVVGKEIIKIALIQA